jgi:hypothetical protein
MAADGPKKLGDLLGALVARYGLGKLTARQELERAWTTVADEPTRLATRVGAIRRGTLEILVTDSVLLQELESFRKQELLDAMKPLVKATPLTGLKFRRGH